MAGLLACFGCAACNTVCATASAACSCAGCLFASSASDTPRDLMVGKLRSMGVIIISIVLGLLTQYLWAEDLADSLGAWAQSCEGNPACIGNSAVLR